MNLRRPVTAACIGIAALCSVVISSSYSGAEETLPKVKIGAILSLTGGLTQWCTFFREGMLLAQAELSPSKVAILFEDDKSVEKIATVSAGHKLAYEDKVDVLFTWTSSSLAHLSTIAEKSKTPLVVASYDSRSFYKSEYLFPAFVNYDLVAQEMVDALLTANPTGNIAAISAVDTWSSGFINPIEKELHRRGKNLVAHEVVNPNDTDVRAIVLRLRSLGVSSIAAPLYGPVMFALIRTARELGLKATIHVADGMYEEDIKALGAAANGVMMSQVSLDSPTLAEKYRATYHRTPSSIQLGLVAEGYDIVRHLYEAANNTPKGKTLAATLSNHVSTGELGVLMLGTPPLRSAHTQITLTTAVNRR